MNNSVETNTTKKKERKPSNWLFRFFQGSLVGVGGILPGISGGVLCAIFGLYQPLMEVLANPFKNIKKHFRLLLPVVIGIAFGFLGLAELVVIIFRTNKVLATCVFVGLILGMLPSLWKEAGEYGRPKSSYVSMGLAFAVLFSVFMILEFATKVNISNPGIFWFAICGVFWGLGVVVPGMSASSPLLFLGLYEPLMDLISNFMHGCIGIVSGDNSFGYIAGMLKYIIPFGIAILATLIGLAKPVNYLLSKKPSQIYHAIFGIVLGTTLPILISKETNMGEDTFLKLGFIVIGFACAWLIDLLSKKFSD